MTKQKFYEFCVEKSLEYADPDGPLSEILKILDYNKKMRFPEIKLKLSVCGVPENFPLKENFESWGIGYLVQLLGFAASIDNGDFTRKLFSFLNDHRELWDIPGKKTEFGEAVYYAYYENLTDHSRDFASSLAGFILRNFGGEKWYDKFLSLCWGFGIIDSESTNLFFETRNKLRKNKVLRENGEHFDEE